MYLAEKKRNTNRNWNPQGNGKEKNPDRLIISTTDNSNYEKVFSFFVFDFEFFQFNFLKIF